MVERIPPEGEWTTVSYSSLVRAVAYDRAAERIFVRLIPYGLVVFESCGEEVWRRFTVPGTSMGAYVQNVLERHPHTRY